MEQLALITKGGVLMYPIVFLSVLSLAIFIERLATLKPAKFAPKEFLAELYGKLRAGDVASARAIAQENDSAAGRIAAEVLTNLDLPVNRLMELAEETGRRESTRLERFLPTLQTIASVSPLLGLLGTVIGMIKTFVVISDQGVGNAQALAGGISEALITTAAGLSVAIPTMLFYYVVRSRSERIITELEFAASRVTTLIFKGNS